MLRFWNRRVCMDIYRLTRNMFDHAHTASLNGLTNWCSDVFIILVYLNLQSVFNRKGMVNIEECRTIMINRQKDKWSNVVHIKPKLRFYSMFKDCFDVEKYIMINLFSSERSVLAQTRFGFFAIAFRNWKIQ